VEQLPPAKPKAAQAMEKQKTNENQGNLKERIRMDMTSLLTSLPLLNGKPQPKELQTRKKQ